MADRVIKFRAWDGKEIRLSPLMSEGLHHLAVWFEAHSTFSSGQGQDSQITQFTGLQDKNGKDIYEGDILQITSWTGFQSTVVWYDEDLYWGIREYADSTCSPLGDWKPHDIEIIGNVYETPELLEQSAAADKEA